MLRKFSKRTAEADTTGKVKKHKKKEGTLGDAAEKQEGEKVLEDLVFGSGDTVLNNIQKEIDRSKERKKSKLTEAKPAWEDEDDEDNEEIISKRKAELRSTDSAKQKDKGSAKAKVSRKQQFEKISGQPEWAKLKWQKAENDEKGK